MAGQPEEVEITISPSGEVQVEAKGTVGKACEALTKPYEDALGGAITGVRRKPEYNQTAAIPARQNAGK